MGGSLLGIDEEAGFAAVPALLVENEGTQPVLLVEGEVIAGGLQHRTLNLSVLVPALASLSLPVSCIEAGRWGNPEHSRRSDARAPVGAVRTNPIIGGAAPSAYLQTLEANAGASADTIDQWLATHLITPDTLRDDFTRFWEQRKNHLLGGIAAVMGEQLRSDEQDLLAEDEVDEDEAA